MQPTNLRCTLVCGIDEVGRGSWAGPIFACATLFWCDPDDTTKPPLTGIQDSKQFKGAHAKLNRAQKLLEILKSPQLVSLGIGYVDAAEIDAHGIEEANQKAFTMALQMLSATPEHIIVDGSKAIKGWPFPKQLISPKGDSIYWQVGAASIAAKVVRDQYMEELGRSVPGYHFEDHSGYGTLAHADALQRLGPSKHHRITFLKKQLPPELPPQPLDPPRRDAGILF